VSSTHFTRRLLELKAEKGMSWRDLADAIGHRNPRHIQALAEGRHEPSLATVRKLAEVFGVTQSDMLGES
jgi:transcriptional regulator with XRE-family HTH domain